MTQWQLTDGGWDSLGLPWLTLRQNIIVTEWFLTIYSELFCSTHNGLIQFNRNSIMINDCNTSTAMFVRVESNGKSIERFILITQSHMITLAVPYIIMSTILINGGPFPFMIQNTQHLRLQTKNPFSINTKWKCICHLMDVRNINSCGPKSLRMSTEILRCLYCAHSVGLLLVVNLLPDWTLFPNWLKFELRCLHCPCLVGTGHSPANIPNWKQTSVSDS